MQNNKNFVCNRCLKDSDKINRVGQCEKCAKQTKEAQRVTIKGRGIGLEKWFKLMEKEGSKVFSN